MFEKVQNKVFRECEAQARKKHAIYDKCKFMKLIINGLAKMTLDGQNY